MQHCKQEAFFSRLNGGEIWQSNITMQIDVLTYSVKPGNLNSTVAAGALVYVALFKDGARR